MLSHITVLDLSRVYPGHYASLLLADLGAEVIKIEDTTHPDFLRSFSGSSETTSPQFQNLNRNKKSLRLNLKTEEGKTVFLRLAAQSQVIIENFRPGTVDKMGIGYDTVKQVNPAVVYCSISGYGQTGPLSHRGGHDLNFMSISGYLGHNTDKEQNPVLPKIVLSALSAGMFGVIAILAALNQCQLTKTGCHIDNAITDSMLTMSGTTSTKTKDGTDFNPICNQVYKTKDGRWVSIAALEEKFWHLFCQTVDRIDLIPFHYSPAVPENPGFTAITALFASKTFAEWIALLSDADCCFSPVLSVNEALETVHTQERNMSLPVEGNVKQVAFPVKFNTYQPPASAAPAWGEHSLDILRTFGFDAKDIEDLLQKGIIS